MHVQVCIACTHQPTGLLQHYQIVSSPSCVLDPVSAALVEPPVSDQARRCRVNTRVIKAPCNTTQTLFRTGTKTKTLLSFPYLAMLHNIHLITAKELSRWYHNTGLYDARAVYGEYQAMQFDQQHETFRRHLTWPQTVISIHALLNLLRGSNNIPQPHLLYYASVILQSKQREHHEHYSHHHKHYKLSVAAHFRHVGWLPWGRGFQRHVEAMEYNAALLQVHTES